jgi:hypothetical protein
VNKYVRALLVLLLTAASLPLITAASNGESHQPTASEFWTHARVAQAKPRDFVMDAGGSIVLAGKPIDTPGNGGGGGKPGGNDGGSTVVTGASYNDGTAIDGSTGKVLFAMDGSYWVCSATVITDTAANRSVVLTAGHCVYDEENGAFATYWVFIPDYDAAPAPLSTSTDEYCPDTLYGCWESDTLVVHNGFASAGSFANAVTYDWGFAVVAQGTETSALVESVVTPQDIEFSEYPFDATEAWAFGYPAAKKWKGDDLIYCRGPIDGDPYNNEDTYRLNECKMTGGSSGGSWLAEFNDQEGTGTVFSLNSYGYTGVNAMHGPFFNPNTAATYSAALTANGNTVVG